MKLELSPKSLVDIVKRVSLYTTKPLINPVVFEFKRGTIYTVGYDEGKTLIYEALLLSDDIKGDEGIYVLPPQQIVKALSAGFMDDKITIEWVSGESGERIVVQGHYDRFEVDVPTMPLPEDITSLKDGMLLKILPKDEGIRINYQGTTLKPHATYRINTDVLYRLYTEGDFRVEYDENGLKLGFIGELSKFIRTLPVDTLEYNKSGVVGIDLDNFKRIQRFISGNITFSIFDNFVLLRKEVVKGKKTEFQNFVLAVREV